MQKINLYEKFISEIVYFFIFSDEDISYRDFDLKKILICISLLSFSFFILFKMNDIFINNLNELENYITIAKLEKIFDNTEIINNNHRLNKTFISILNENEKIMSTTKKVTFNDNIIIIE